MIYSLKKIFEKIKQWAADFFNVFLSLIKIVVLSKLKVNIPQTTNDTVIVLGNGPSFKESLLKNPDFFKNKDFVCVNNFPSTPEYDLLEPSACVMLDDGYFPKDKTKLSETAINTINNLITKTTWELTLFLPQLSKHSEYLKEIPAKNKNIKLCYFNYTIVEGFDWFKHWIYKKNIGMPQCQNVVAASACLALNMGYKTIELIGVENSFFKNIIVDENNILYLEHFHFYSDKSKKHITRAYKMPGMTESINMSEFLMLGVKTFKSYYSLEKYARYLGKKIYNLTEDSYVDAFERKKITDLK
jgi:hypothetical protein